MVRTQIQLAEETYGNLKAIAAEKDLPMAEIVRRATEDYVVRNPPGRCKGEWKMPEPVDLGEVLVPVEEWRYIAWAPEINGRG